MILEPAVLIAGFIFATMRQQSYLNSAIKIIGSYKGDIPFAIHLKKYFAANKKYGSKDRKQVSSLCYDFYRLGRSMAGVSIEERIIAGTLLCEQEQNEFLQFHRPGWNQVLTAPLEEKASGAGLVIEDIFPWKEELSEGIDPYSLCSSFLTQPNLFLRIRPGQRNRVIQKLDKAGLRYESIDEDCIALPNSSKLDHVIEPDREAVVQDRNSQQVLNCLKDLIPGIRHPVSVWDCCAASGGKSILAYDIFKGNIELTVSDIRESILSNLKKRFTTAGIRQYEVFVANLQTSNFKPPASNFQLIICDAPCTGSGTWSRTPEQIYFFEREMIDDYAARQKKIVGNVIPALKEKGRFIYITCSVFRKENEEMVNFIKEKFHLQLLQMELLKGYDKKADSMFVAVFRK